MNFWTQQAVLRSLDRAFEAFFRRLARGETPGYPRFKSHSRFSTLAWGFTGHAGGCAITTERRLRLQGVGCVKVKWHRPIPENAALRELRVTRKGVGSRARFYAAVSLQLPCPKPLAPTGEVAGMDMGVRTFAALSTGERIAGPRAGRVGRAKVRRAGRRVARRKQGSRRFRKATALLAREREREANRRRDAAHKAARELVSRFDLIAREELAIPNMLRSARGSVERPGRNVAAKCALNREIADQGWAMFLRFLADKAEEAGRRVVKVHPGGTSRTCAACGVEHARSRSDACFRCVACGYADDADVNAAKVILARALEASGEKRPGRGRQAKTVALAAVA